MSLRSINDYVEAALGAGDKSKHFVDVLMHLRMKG